MVKERAVAKQTCTDHCGGCGRHFHGLTAFDKHRVDGYCENPSVVVNTKRDGTLTPALMVWTGQGYCDKTADCWDNGARVKYNHPVEVWQVYATAEQKEKLALLNANR